MIWSKSSTKCFFFWGYNVVISICYIYSAIISLHWLILIHFLCTTDGCIYRESQSSFFIYRLILKQFIFSSGNDSHLWNIPEWYTFSYQSASLFFKPSKPATGHSTFIPAIGPGLPLLSCGPVKGPLLWCIGFLSCQLVCHLNCTVK